MSYANIVTILSAGADDAIALATAAELTHACGGETRAILALGSPEPRYWSFITPSALGPALRDIKTATGAARRSVEALARELSLEKELDLEPKSGRIRLIGEHPSRDIDLHGEFALCDLMVLGFETLDTPSIWNTLIVYGLMEARTPVLIVAQAPREPTAPAMVAWDGSHQAGRAVRAALPLLKQSSRVVILQDPDHLRSANRAAADPERLAEYLRLHGVERSETVILRGASRGDGLARTALSEDVGLLVAGAFGQSRLREEIFGGLTHALLASKRVFNLLVCH